MKLHLFKTLVTLLFLLKSCNSVLVRIETTLNSRPISPLSSDPSDFTALMPGHFLTVDIFNAIPKEHVVATLLNRLTTSSRVTQFTRWLWHRWRHDYLCNFKVVKKWCTSTCPSLAVNTVVFIQNNKQSPFYWRIDRITEVQPGDDKVIRITTVGTIGGSTKHTVCQLCLLSFEGAVSTRAIR